jgi:hypothetical protein
MREIDARVHRFDWRRIPFGDPAGVNRGKRRPVELEPGTFQTGDVEVDGLCRDRDRDVFDLRVLLGLLADKYASDAPICACPAIASFSPTPEPVAAAVRVTPGATAG